MSALSRRQVFLSSGAVAAALAVSGAVMTSAVMTSPDAELLAACDEFGAAGAGQTALFDANEGSDEDVPEHLLKPFGDRISALADVVVDTRAATLAGVIARARAAVAFDCAIADPDTFSSGLSEDLGRAVVRDLLAVAGGAA